MHYGEEGRAPGEHGFPRDEKGRGLPRPFGVLSLQPAYAQVALFLKSDNWMPGPAMLHVLLFTVSVRQ